jgi:peptidyl-prolyl cis-trans isomerase A (cyclophilin A)
MRTRLVIAAILIAALPGRSVSGRQARALPHVLVLTDVGDIEIEVDVVHAPISAGRFLKHVDAGFYTGGRFHRTVKLDNQPDNQVKIEVIQASLNPNHSNDAGDPIVLERTNLTGLKHLDGVVSTPRGAPDSARSGFFICINDQPSLDFGGKRNPDGQGFAAFGRVVKGMDVVRKIQREPNNDAQNLTPPIQILSIKRSQ